MKTSVYSFLFCLLFATAATAQTTSVQGGQFKQLGFWQVHYIAFPSTSIPAQVARTYTLERAGDNALINIAVLKDDTAQQVNIEGHATNLLGQKSNLTFQEINEGDSIYYIAQMRFDDEEVYRFEITLKQGNTTEVLRFHQKLYHH